MSKPKSHTTEEASNFLVDQLKIDRRKGKYTPDHPVKAKVLAARWNERFGDNITDVEIREWANYARGVLGQPIYSDSNGYSWCIIKQEWDRTKAHLLSRIKKIHDAATKPDEYWAKLSQPDIFDKD